MKTELAFNCLLSEIVFSHSPFSVYVFREAIVRLQSSFLQRGAVTQSLGFEDNGLGSSIAELLIPR